MCIKKGLKKPDFIQESDFRSVLYRTAGEKVTENQRIILKSIEQNQYITIPELSAIIKISERKTKENLSKLKAKGFLERIGPDKGGHWKVNEKQ